MHILIIFLGFVGTALFWALRLNANKQNLNDAARTLHGAAVQAKNMPRQRRFKKAHNARDFDLVEDAREAATVLMIMVARAGQMKGISPAERATIEGLLVADMDLNADDADGLARQMESIVHDVTLPETALSPMNAILHGSVDRDTAADLASRAIIGVYPSPGWWRTRPALERYDSVARYALLISIHADDVDIYTPVANQIGLTVDV